MSYPRLWIIPKLDFIFFFLMAHMIFNWGTISCKSFDPAQTKAAATKSDDYNVLSNYLTSVLNKSRELEEIIYSDILNNLRSALSTERNQSVERNKNEYKIGDVKGKLKKPENKTNTYKANVFLSGTGGKERSLLLSKNVTFGHSRVTPDEYLLGYSGDPFGMRRSIPGLVELSENDSLDPRKKRSVLHLYNMVLCTTGCNPFAYKGYGCYCGFLGSGYVVDGIDSCCKMHDWCYNSAGCPMFLEYFIPYLWKCYHRQPLCAINHGYYGGPGSCAQRLCECDRELALCLRRFPCPSTKALCTSSPWRLLQNILML